MIRALLSALGILTIFALAGIGSLFGPPPAPAEPAASDDGIHSTAYYEGWCVSYGWTVYELAERGEKPLGRIERDGDDFVITLGNETVRCPPYGSR